MQYNEVVLNSSMETKRMNFPNQIVVLVQSNWNFYKSIRNLFYLKNHVIREKNDMQISVLKTTYRVIN